MASKPRRKGERNPVLAIIGNPPMGEVVEIQYIHADNGKLYYHPFSKGVQIFWQKDGTVLLKHKSGRPLTKDF